MPVSILYEDFSDLSASTSRAARVDPSADSGAIDKNRASFEDGYKEGWVDAQAAAQDETSTLNAEVATALQEAGFAYFEARQHIFKSMRPLLEAMIDQVMPVMARETFAATIIEHIQKIAEETEPPMHILCAPETASQLESILEKHVSFPVEIRTEDTLTESQAVLKFSEGQTNIDLSSVIDDLKVAISDFYNLNDQEVRKHA